MTTITPDDPNKHRIVINLGKLRIEIAGWIAVWGSIVVGLVATLQYPVASVGFWNALEKLVAGA